MSLTVAIYVDAQLTAESARQLLPKLWDIELSFVASGDELLRSIQQGRAEVAFLDLTMPGIDGVALLELIHSQELNTLPIVSTQQQIDQGLDARLHHLGAIASLPRPMQTERLEALLHEYGLWERSAASISSHSMSGLQRLFNNAVNEAASHLGNRFRQQIDFERLDLIT